mgnify:CR=1 FL=1
MERYTSEAELRKALEAHAAACEDRVVPARDIRVDCNAGLHPILEAGGFRDEVVGPRLEGQLCRRLDPHLSPHLWRRLSGSLQQQLAEELLRQAPEERWLLRLKHGRLRAILSDAYHPFDHQPVVDHMVDALFSHEDTAAFELYLAELYDDAAEVRVLFDIRHFEFEAADPKIPRRWCGRVELRNNEVGEGSVRIALYLAPEGGTAGLRFAERTVLPHRVSRDIHRRFAEAVALIPRELQGMVVHLREFAAMRVRYPEAAIAALRRRFEDIPEYAAAAIQAAFAAMPGDTGAHLIWALLEAPKHVPAGRIMPYEVQFRLHEMAAWLCGRAGREWLDRLPAPAVQQLGFAAVS